MKKAKKGTRTSRRAGTKSKCIQGSAQKSIPKFKFPRRTKYHRGDKPETAKKREVAA